MRRLLIIFIGVVLLALAWALVWVNRPLDLRAGSVEFAVEPGSSPRAVAQTLVNRGVDASPDLLWLWFRISGQARQIKAGSYEVTAGTSPFELLGKLVRGEQSLLTVVVVEGWTFKQMRRALSVAVQLRSDTQGLSDEDLMSRLGRQGMHPEGRFFPDTYTYAKGNSDLAVYRRALEAMDKQLAQAWSERSAQAQVQTPEQALILASIVEKETGQAADRGLIAGVFNNRLRLGMPLQTDPTVIYGLGERFDGNLRKKDLQTDTAWNTYTRVGLPPTPIALPGKAALWAAVQPATTSALYFVARGDGSSQFSATLQEHNRAVNIYQRSR